MASHNYAAIEDPGNSRLSQNNTPSVIKRLFYFIRRHFYHLLTLFTIGIIMILLFVYTFLLPSDASPNPSLAEVRPVGISLATMEEGRAKCRALLQKQEYPSSYENLRADPNQPPILLKNAIVWDGQGNILANVDLYLKKGLIERIEKEISLETLIDKDKIKVIDVAGHIVTPGIVDMHSHLGVDSWPELDGTDDTNEMTQPLTPFVRTLDAFNPSDKAIRIVASGGVTTTLVLPGSGNLMGGEAFAFKLRPMVSTEDMLVQAKLNPDDPYKRRWMKMACGENPKNLTVFFFSPFSFLLGLGEAFLFRNEFAKAQALKRQQDDWCQSAFDNNNNNQQSLLDQPFPEDLQLESLVALLRHQVLLNVHCYETHDIEAMVRHALEFNFTIAAFHHALEAYRIPQILRRLSPHKVPTVATFADHWGYKKEAFGGNPRAPEILWRASIPVALKSDHPVLNSQRLMFEAAKAAHYGLPAQEALKAVTSTPANALGLGHRLGSIKRGYDADLVIWDRDPLTLGASPLQVLVDGVPLFEDRPITDLIMKTTPHHENSRVVNVIKGGDSTDFILKNVGYYHALKSKEPIDIVVKNGSIVCAAVDCMETSDNMIPKYDIQGGYVLPGFIGVGSKLGLVEISAEASTSDGRMHSTLSMDPKSIPQTVDGIKFSTRHLEEAYRGGVLTAITTPLSDHVVMGVSAAFKTGASSLLQEGALISPAVALHFQIGHHLKSSAFPTISSQISYIRHLLMTYMKADNVYGQAARGEIPTVIVAHNKDEIASLIILKRDHVPKMRLIIQGGAEAHLVAKHLAEFDIGVVLWPSLCTPARFDSRHCLTGSPLTNGTAAHVLHQNGVRVAIGISDDGWARNLAWDAGWLAKTGYGINETDAIDFITTNIQALYGLFFSSSLVDEFIVYDKSPFDMNSRILMIHSK
ncbi:uncharacterized protein BX663DRAFT_461655 [Cokeromyces recurvatus]|uniref:uncharacterized protein n=1 Tax=Cokeromyces recurvatus TaxID=90255 RepID=UPI00221F4E47|nr:uncharacterized protein BX663DRAFT_461655 [Cokeromyces recurvatus]KAI7898530.1 hypothetical protein BX663DRAFT_461655 [Cokeromyces recurvatus]